MGTRCVGTSRRLALLPAPLGEQEDPTQSSGSTLLSADALHMCGVQTRLLSDLVDARRHLAAVDCLSSSMPSLHVLLLN